MRISVVSQRAGLSPAVADFAGGEVADTRRGLQLRVELPTVDARRITRQPPTWVADFFVGGVLEGCAVVGRSPTSVSIAAFQAQWRWHLMASQAFAPRRHIGTSFMQHLPLDDRLPRGVHS